MARVKINRGRLRKERLREEASERLKSWQAKSPAEQLKELDARLGEDVGASRQRARLKPKLVAASKAVSNEAKVKKAKAKTKNKKSKKTKE